MAALTSFLPAPSQPIYTAQDEHSLFKPAPQIFTQKPKKHIPPYGQRDGFVPRDVEDFGDGGAFPEIHVAQYPLDMGRKKNSSQTVVPLQLDNSGRLQYEAVLGNNKQVASKYTDLVEKQVTEDELARPDEEEVAETTAKTRAALEQLVQGKIQAAQPSRGSVAKNNQTPTYVKYTPAQQGAAFNSGAANRIIRMVEMPKDPLEPPKFKHKKVPRGPPSPPVPVMHSPPRKVTAKDQQNWKIPPCISNWKNSKGYTIPLDKRLAADGRGLQEVQINDKFAKLSESLYIAERSAREEVTQRAALNKKVALKEKERREDQLRKMAEEARSHRAGPRETAPEDRKELNEKHERDIVREERARERERELRLEAAGKKGKFLRDEDRDISEKIALGQTATGPRSEESMYDQRLFNQTQGMDAGFGDEDSYNIYSKPLFAGGSAANALYRPRKNQDDFGNEDENMSKLLSTNKFRPDKDFSGVDRSKPTEPRQKPVEFEKTEEDPFGLDEFLNTAKTSTTNNAGNKRPLDKIGSRGGMHAGSAGAKDYEHADSSSKRKKIDFESKRK
jgi:SNW domain-containing protein 1